MYSRLEAFCGAWVLVSFGSVAANSLPATDINHDSSTERTVLSPTELSAALAAECNGEMSSLLSCVDFSCSSHGEDCQAIEEETSELQKQPINTNEFRAATTCSEFESDFCGVISNFEACCEPCLWPTKVYHDCVVRAIANHLGCGLALDDLLVYDSDIDHAGIGSSQISSYSSAKEKEEGEDPSPTVALNALEVEPEEGATTAAPTLEVTGEAMPSSDPEDSFVNGTDVLEQDTAPSSLGLFDWTPPFSSAATTTRMAGRRMITLGLVSLISYCHAWL